MNIGLTTVLMFASLGVLIALGLPLVFALGGTALVFGYFLWGHASVNIVYMAVYGNMNQFLLVAVPLFILMGAILEGSGIAEDMYNMMYRWMGPLRGGLAIGTVLISTVIATMTGISATACVTMGMISLPSMMKRSYDKRLVTGCIMAGAALGPLIPPSVIFIVYGLLANASVGRLFAAGLFPGLLLSALFMLYIGIRCFFQPSLAPALPKEERADWAAKMVSLKAIILPLVLILMVLGSIFSGMATPTEAAGVGAIGAILCALVYRRLTWKLVREAAITSLPISAMCIWITFGAFTFSAVYQALGATELIKGFLVALNVSPWLIVAAIQVSLFVLGCFLDPLGILMITAPIYVPVILALGYDTIWYGVIFCVNMEMAYLTPPFGFNLFYMKGIVPKEITMEDLYHSVVPFVLLQALGLVLVILFPEIALNLPNILFGKQG